MTAVFLSLLSWSKLASLRVSEHEFRLSSTGKLLRKTSAILAEVAHQ